MYRLVLELPFRVTLVHRDRFETPEKAQECLATLPSGFVIAPENAIDINPIIEVPFLKKSQE